MNWGLFASTFTLIALAELPDKTAFATILMATRNRPMPVFIGAALAFLIQNTVAVVFGKGIRFLPQNWVHLAAGIMFLVFAIMMLRKTNEAAEADSERPNDSFWRVVRHSFLIIFIAEWGDLTQLAMASLVAKYNDPWTIFTAATLSLWLVTAVAVFIGHHFKKLIHPRILNYTAAAAFTAVGIYFLINWSRGSA